ncbi:MAG TPA: LysR family transcriptional regulator [Candidatus Desulfobacillus sp.]|mgnify:CR=1 FL=1|nr:LysR family transcriptional regulator [Candidatus Desulfobacillus sp.]
MDAIDLHANDLILFARIVQAGSFTRAASQTGLPKATLSRRLSLLEESLGERLMQRTTRRLALTAFGEQMLEHAQRLAEENEAVAALAQNKRVTPQGVLRVSLPPEYERARIARLVADYHAACPQVRIDLDFSARRVALVAERFDVAVRVASQLPDDSTLVARRLAAQEHGLYASPGYLRRAGRPRRPDDLAAHSGLMLSQEPAGAQGWRLARGRQVWQGLPRQLILANSVGMLLALARHDLGIVGLSEAFAADALQAGALERVLPRWQLPSLTVWCVTPGRRLLPRRTVVFIEMLQQALGEG